MPEKYLPYLRYNLFGVLGYHLAVAAVFVYHLKAQPKVRNSVRDLQCELWKIRAFWLPFMLLAFACGVTNVYLATNMLDFSRDWLDILHEHRADYECTEERLFIDTKALIDEHRAEI